MALITSLESVVRAIAGAIMNAQNLVEKAQLENIATFFDDEHKPRVFDLELPAIHSAAAEGETYLYRLPLLSLVPHSALIIGEAEVDLDVELGGFEEAPPDSAGASLMGQAGAADGKASLLINPVAGTLARKSGNAAHIKLKLVSAEKSEGLARLLNDVVKGQGYTTATD